MLGVLIVDNNKIFRNLLAETLRLNFPTLQIHEASNGEEAIEVVESQMPDLVFMDIELGGENGLSIVRKIKSEHPDIIIAILTSYDLPEYKEAARQNKADYFFTKGISTQDDVLSAVNSIYVSRAG